MPPAKLALAADENKIHSIGSCNPKKNAKMHDKPSFRTKGARSARNNNGKGVARFETCAICVETNKILGCITWGFEVPDSEKGGITPLGGGVGDVGMGSGDFRKLVQKANAQPAMTNKIGPTPSHPAMLGTPIIPPSGPKK